MQFFFLLLVMFRFVYASCPDVSAEDVVKKVRGNLPGKVEEVEELEGGFFQVVVLRGKHLYPVYTDCSLRYLFIGQAIDTTTGKNLAKEALGRVRGLLVKQKEKELISVLGKEKFEAIVKKIPGVVNSLSVIYVDIPQAGLITLGNPSASKIVYIIVDPMCPYCAKLHGHVEKIVARRNDVQFKVLFYPLSFHRGADKLSSAVVCSGDPAMLSIIFKAIGNRSAVKKFSSMSCERGDKIIEEHVKFSNLAGIKGTPTVVFANRIKISGAVSEKTLETLIDLMYEE